MTTQLTTYNNQNYSLNDIGKIAGAFASSGLFGIKTVDQGVALMMIAQAEGMHPAIAARDYHIIEGRPALKADAMLARFQAAGGKVEWREMSDTTVSAQFSHQQGGSVVITWTMEMAKRAQLSTKLQKNGGPNMWQKFPRQMLRARVISEGIRTVFPGVSVGMYTPEEVEDFDDKPSKPKDMGAAQVVEQQPVRQVQPTSKPETDEWRTMGNTVRDELNAALTLTDLIATWESWAVNLEKLQAHSTAAYNYLNDLYLKRQHLLSQAHDLSLETTENEVGAA